MIKKITLMSVALLALAACGGGTITNPSQSRSSDAMLRSILASFQAGCISNAPSMNAEAISASFDRNPPKLARNMSFVASGKENSFCSVNVTNYGTNRPAPSYGDVNTLLRALHSKVGGSMQLKTADSSATIRTARGKYSLGAAIQSDGQLLLVMYY